ncbi:DUF5134 domain-containing protein [Paenarthrobacter sp. NPDC056912]|uniref:DUF5134 domain-containing protein n=1 Tax=Paenarthrobacter sp. NPDC056912 TaxID=3345965 RepID=UPI003671D1A4
MFNIPAITWTLTVVLLLSGTWHLLQALRPGRRTTDRINQGLHALMHTLMAAMLWNAAPGTTLIQILLLAGATFWFIIQAVARPHYKTFCAGTNGRLKCTYHALTMAAAALMITMMTTPTTTNPTPTTTGAAHTHNHHTTTAATGTAFDNTPTLAITLTIIFGTAAALFLLQLLRRRKPTTNHHTTNHHTTNRTEHGLEATGATIMALMFATMTA